MDKLKDIIDSARRELGVCEIPMGSNDVKYNHEYWGERSSYADLPWCVVFLWWLCRQVGVEFPNTAHCNGVEAFAKEHGRWVTGDYQPGDMVIFDYNSDGNRDHIGLVVSVSGTRLNTIEGNYGDKVASVVRSAGEIAGAYRPEYSNVADDAIDASSVSSADTFPEGEGLLPRMELGDYGPAVAFLQGGLRGIGFPCSNSYRPDGTADGEFGEGTAAALRSAVGKDTVDDAVWAALIGGVG